MPPQVQRARAWLVGIGLVVVVSRWALGPRRRPQRDRLGSTRPDPGSRFASALAATGLGWPCSSVCGLFASCCQAGDPDAQTPRSQERSAKHSVGGLGEKTETLGRAVIVVHRMLAACASEDIKSDGRHGSMRVSKVVDGWIYSVREKVVGPKKEKGIARLEIEQTGLEILS